MGKCAFNREGLSDDKFSWVREFKSDKHKAMCCVINFERMGESAMKSYMKGEKQEWNTSATSSSTHSLLMLQVVTKGRNLLLVVPMRVTISVLFIKRGQRVKIYELNQEPSSGTETVSARHF